MIEEGHARLTLRPRIPQSLSANSSGFIRRLLDDGIVVCMSQDTSHKPANHATRTRVYRRVK
jgi:hypothetical protein